jgi:propionyl-CoA synthetase
VLKDGVDRNPNEIADELKKRVREEIGAIACFQDVAVVGRLPKTRSGKVLRATMRQIADGKEYRMPSTIDDPVILDDIAGSLQGLGYPRRQV